MAPSTKDTQTGDGNNEESLAQALSTARDRNARGNTFFKEGKYKRALDEYRKGVSTISSTALNSETMSVMVTLRSDLAACFLEMGQYEQAGHWARGAVAMDPLHLKSYKILCKAQHLLKWSPFEFAETMSVVVALTLPGRLDGDMLPIFNELAGTKPLQPSASGLQLGYQLLPAETGEYACVASDRELQRAISAKKKMVVLKPGSYSGGLGSLQLDSTLTLIGLGKVNVTSGGSGHSLHLICGQLHARHLNLVGDIRSVVCVGTEHAKLMLFKSTIEDHKGQGVLIIGGDAYLQGCTFRNLGKQAVEARGGSVRLIDCNISKCRQGVVVSGGLRLVEINDCRIEDVAREGLLVSGKCRSGPTHVEFGLEELRANLPDATRRGVESDGSTVLEVKIVDSVVTGCRSFGLLLDDMDAEVSIVDSKLVDNAPAACYVKGGTTVLLDHCQIEVDKNRSGLTVGINYNATVTSSGNKFVVVDRKSAMVEEVSAGGGSGMCKPIVDQNNVIVVQQAGSTSQSKLPRASKSEESGAQDLGKGASSRSVKAPNRAEARTLSLRELSQTSRRVLHSLRNLPVFCGVRDTFGNDLSLGQELSAPRTVRILLGASSDIRNLLKTLVSLQQNPHLLVHVVLNDWNLAVLARTIVLLSLIVQGTPAEDVLAIWANDALTISQREHLDGILVKLAYSLPDWMVCSEESGSNLAVELLEVFAAWRDCSITLEELDSLHAQSMTEDCKNMVVDFVRGRIGNTQVDNGINQHISTSNVKRTKAMTSANVLFLEAPSLNYTLHWASSIYNPEEKNFNSSSSWSSATGLESTGPEGLYELLMRTITPDEINVVADLFKQRALQVGVMNCNILDGMLHGGCLQLLHKLNRQPQRPSRAASFLFDFIDLSSTADYLSMPAVVQAGFPLLKVEKHAVLHVESFTWGMTFDTKQPLEFLKCSLGMNLDTYKELLGVSVQAQVVGTSRLPLLQTQWTWDLDANQEAWLSGAMVLMEMMTTIKLHFSIDRVSYISSDGIRLNGDGMMAGFMGGIEYSSPLTMLHFIRLRLPEIAFQMLPLLMSANDTYDTRKWELMHHIFVQHEPRMAPYTFFPFYFQANVQYANLLACPEAPLCLMVSIAPVKVARAPVDVDTATAVYLMEAFSYSIESDRVQIFLPLEHQDEYKHYFMTLCAVTNATKLRALGSSVPFSELNMKLDQAPFSAWTPCKRMAQRALLPDRLLSDVLVLEDLVAKILTSGRGNVPPQPWTTHAVLQTSRFVIVEILLPRPLPGPDMVAITVTSSGSSLKVSAKTVNRRVRRGVYVFPDQEHTIQIPASVSFGDRTTKLSRKLGIMIVHLPKVVEVST